MAHQTVRQRSRAGVEREHTEHEATAVLEPDWNAVAYGLHHGGAPDPLPLAMRQLHTSLYTLRAYKRWMLKIRGTWMTENRR
ncbi:hypothetical protein BH24PSE2_BH24PSE2_09060 [soil metagenome]